MSGTCKYTPKNLVVSFARKRHNSLSFPFLKENGELLMIVKTSDYQLDEYSLAAYRSFYLRAKKFCDFFPQYYRFILGITLCLEDLGMEGHIAEELCDFTLKQKCFQFETSDLRRMEILTMLSHRNYDVNLRAIYGKGLEERVMEFMSNPQCFVKFNRPLFYEMTHYIFYLTHYGKKAISLPKVVFDGLQNIGNLALLDDDIDLLSETCLCYRFSGRKPPKYWEQYIQVAADRFTVSFEKPSEPSDPTKLTDNYHDYLTTNWLLAYSGRPAFTQSFLGTTPYFYKPSRGRSALSEISLALYALSFETDTLAKFKYIRPDFSTILSHKNKNIVSQLVQSTGSASQLIEAYSDGTFAARELSV